MLASTRDAIASPPPPTASELERIAAGDQLCCRNLIDRWETVNRVMASRYARRPFDLDDLMQVGRLAV